MHQRPPADRYNKDDLVTTSMGPLIVNEPETRTDTNYHGEEADGEGQADFLDDVFGADEAPELTPPTTAAAAPARAHAEATPAQQHPSDMPRLQQDHATAGYRDGIAAGKATSLQAGFDEGFTLGAALGSAAGSVLGLLEGLAEASSEGSAGDEMAGLLAQARQQLTMTSIFAPAYFAPDGTWTYEVGDEKEEATVLDVAQAHPLIGRWRDVAAAQAQQRLGMRLDDGDAAVKAVLGLGDHDGGETEAEKEEGASTAEPTTAPSSSATAAASARGVPQASSVLDW